MHSLLPLAHPNQRVPGQLPCHETNPSGGGTNADRWDVAHRTDSRAPALVESISGVGRDQVYLDPSTSTSVAAVPGPPVLHMIVVRRSTPSRGGFGLLHGLMLGRVHPMTSIGRTCFERAGVTVGRRSMPGTGLSGGVQILTEAGVMKTAHDRSGDSGSELSSTPVGCGDRTPIGTMNA